jgi:uncharacterized protein YqgC (DUF456 family)
MATTLIIIGSVLILAGIAGCFLPIVPGPPLSWLGLLLLEFTEPAPVSTEALVIYLVLVVLVTVADYFVPILGAKFSGGTKRGNIGSTIGVVAGFFIFPPFGIILMPFVGAVLGELSGGKEFKQAMRAGFGTFLGFLAGTFLKLAVSLVITFSFVKIVITNFT